MEEERRERRREGESKEQKYSTVNRIVYLSLFMCVHE